MKIYHAHGFVVRNNFPFKGDEKWNWNSDFGKVFGDFESAKNYLLNCFEERLGSIYSNDEVFSPGVEDRLEIKDKNSSWRREYVDEYIWYNLLISEIDTDIWRCERDKTAPDEIVWHLRYTGEVRTRYYVFGEEEYEYRLSDMQEGAGTKFRPGDIVTCTDREAENRHKVFVVYKAPECAKEGAIWQNHYSVLGIGVYDREPCVEKLQFHEADLAPFSTEREYCPYKQQLLALKNVIVGNVTLPQDIWNDILKGKILFNECFSWRDIPELYRKNEGNA